MAGFVGGCIAFVGCGSLLNILPEIGNDLTRRNVGTTTQKVLHLAANLLKVIGQLALAVAAIVAGATLYSSPASLAIGALVQEVIGVSTPYFLTGVGGLLSSRIVEIAIQS